MRAIIILGFIAAAVVGLHVNGAVLERRPNTTLRFPQKPGSFGYQFVDVLDLPFDHPTQVVFPPGETNRLLVVEQPGRIIAITNLAVPTKSLFLDLSADTSFGPEEGMVALALHPDFARNGRLFIHRVVSVPVPDELEPERFNQISEVRVSPDDPNRADPQERILIRQPYLLLNHFGGDLQFGPDGYLYGSMGDGFDFTFNSQMIDGGFFSAIWRIDVDDRPGSLAPNPHPSSLGGYRIPADNPFVGATHFLNIPVEPAEVRTEFWSVGLRNPFRFGIDAATGDVWVGDVGLDTYESVFISPKGANHGWPAREGISPGPLVTAVPADFVTNPVHRYVAPLWGYGHDVGHAVLGGVVYRGSRWSSLFGSFLLADHSFGWVWSLRANTDGTPDLRGLGYLPAITSFAVQPHTGDVWISELATQRLWRLDYSPVFTGVPLPPTLADTGAFSDLASLTPAAGVVPYQVNQSFWSDDARKRRWFSVPDPSRLIDFKTNETWIAPAGTVWVKHFDLELIPGVPESARRLETRFLVRNANGVYGATYRWDSATNATLVPEAGLDEDIVRTVNGVAVTQRWHYPGRAECLVCHTRPAGWSLSFNTAQLNRDADYGDARTNQIAALQAAGYLHQGPDNRVPLPVLADPTNSQASIEWRARSYLAANCSPCHRPGGSGLGRFDARLETPTALAGLVNGPLNGDRGDPANRVLVPGDPAHSVMYQRLSMRGPGQMPPLASSVPDPVGESLLRQWIETMTSRPSDEVAELDAKVAGDGLDLHVLQPANRAVRLEKTTSLTHPEWSPVIVPGLEPFFPERPRDISIKVPVGEASVFFRVETDAP